MSNIYKILINPYLWIIMSVAALLVSKFMLKIDYMNFFEIISNQIGNFRCSKQNKILWIPFSIHFIVPLFIALAITNIRIIDDIIINNLLIIVSILTSMLFTLLVLIIDMKNKVEIRDRNQGGRIKILIGLIKETYYSIMFEILISVFLLILSFLHIFSKYYSYATSLVIYYLVFVLTFNLFMILKRIFRIIEDDLDQEP